MVSHFPDRNISYKGYFITISWESCLLARTGILFPLLA